MCPCGSKLEYTNCCGPFILETLLPSTPEQLMRSRYTAFTQANIPYIMKTMTDTALDEFDPIGFKKWVTPLQWEALEILSAPPTEEDGLFGEVEFIATYSTTDGESFDIHERSRFEKIGGKWYYVEGETPRTVETVYNTDKIGRNDPCHCGSGRKYKKCCLAS
ncbi:MAG: hypothetical protein CMF48_02485 [Legionellales bacterium]|nr:hypothetical protein [Legionellales bacterium]